MTHFFGYKIFFLWNVYDVLGVMWNQNNSLPLPQCKYMFLTFLSVNASCNFSELHLLRAGILLQISNYFSKLDLENIRNKSSVIVI